jgi:hypothetical protein
MTRNQILLSLVGLASAGFGCTLIVNSPVFRGLAIVKDRVPRLYYEFADLNGASEEHPWGLVVGAILIGAGFVGIGAVVVWVVLVSRNL